MEDPLSLVLEGELDGAGGAVGVWGFGGDEADVVVPADRGSRLLWEAISPSLPSSAYAAHMRQLIPTITKAITAALPGSKVEQYGSTITGVHLDGSDVDIVMTCDSKAVPEMIDAIIPALAAASLGTITDVRQARVPLVRLNTKGGLECEITFNRQFGPQNTRLIHAFAEATPSFRVLCRAIKVWKRVRRLPDSRGSGLSSYAWTLIAMHFLQRTPSARSALSSPPDDPPATGWEARGLRELLRQFFSFFHAHDRAVHVMSVLDGGRLATRESLRWNAGVGGSVCIQDPVENWRDLGKMVSPEAWGQIHAEVLRGLLATSDARLCGEVLADTMAVCGAGGTAVGEVRLLLVPSGLALGVVREARATMRITKHSKERQASMCDIDVEVDVLRSVRGGGAGAGGGGGAAGRTFSIMGDTQLLHPCGVLGPIGALSSPADAGRYALDSAGEEVMANIVRIYRALQRGDGPPANRLFELREDNSDDNSEDDTPGGVWGVSAPPPTKRARTVREGDWRCPKCENYNFEFRTKCNRCGEDPKTGGSLA